LTSPSVTAAHATELAAAGGIITAQDLAGAAPQERELLRVQVSLWGVIGLCMYTVLKCAGS
jgi:hypothetical protein